MAADQAAAVVAAATATIVWLVKAAGGAAETEAGKAGNTAAVAATAVTVIRVPPPTTSGGSRQMPRGRSGTLQMPGGRGVLSLCNHATHQQATCTHGTLRRRRPSALKPQWRLQKPQWRLGMSSASNIGSELAITHGIHITHLAINRPRARARKINTSHVSLDHA